MRLHLWRLQAWSAITHEHCVWPVAWDGAFCSSRCVLPCWAVRKLSEVLAGLYPSKLPKNALRRGKIACAQLFVMIPLENKKYKRDSAWVFWKEAKKWLESNFRGQKWEQGCLRKDYDTVERAPMKMAAVVRPSKPLTWWQDTDKSSVETVKKQAENALLY